MKYLIRYCCLLLCFLLLFAVFSLPVSAKNVSVPSYTVRGYTQTIYSGVPFTQGLSGIKINNDTIEKWNGEYAGSFTATSTQSVSFQTSYHISADSGYILQPEHNTKVTIKNMWFQHYFVYNGVKYFTHIPDNVRALITYEGGSMEYVEISELKQSTDALKTVTFEFTPKKQVKNIEIILTVNKNAPLNVSFKIGGALGEWYDDNQYDVIIEQTNEETGLLKGIVEWLKGIKNGITDLFDSIADLPSKIWGYLSQGFADLKNGLTDLFNSIAELPSKIWQLISEGLKSLFVPDSDFIVGFKDDFDSLLSSRFGAIYQVCDKITDVANSIINTDVSETNTYIDLPLVTIPLPDNNKFSFGGWSIPIIPEGFHELVFYIRIAVGVACTFLFINGLMKRYEEVFGGE